LVFAVPFAVIAGYLYATARVVLPSLLNHLVLVATVASILFLAAPLGVLSIPVGGVLGTAVAFALIFAAFRRQRGRFHFDLRDTTVLKRVGGLLFPTMVFTAGGYVNLLTDQIVASSIKGGAVSLLAYSQFLLMLPYALVTLPLLTAIFPEMARHQADDGGGAVNETLGNGFLLLFLALLPILIAVLFFRIPLIELFYQHGEFTPGLVPEAADILLAYGPTMILLSCNSLMQRLFLVERKMVPLMTLTLVSLAANLAMDLYFATRFSVVGIALATSINETWYFAAIVWLLRKSLPGVFPRWARRLAWQGLAAGGAMLAGLIVSTRLVAFPGPDRKVSLVAALAVHGGIAAIVYGSTLLAFGRKRVLALLLARKVEDR
ncbi:MAG TPA: lipid II flippase MurJ, partial [Candidatus Aminicenantes bacterium]|nr:lipid II flippase MurJ [Candidatus Aminicenantes bacterium]